MSFSAADLIAAQRGRRLSDVPPAPVPAAQARPETEKKTEPGAAAAKPADASSGENHRSDGTGNNSTLVRREAPVQAPVSEEKPQTGSAPVKTEAHPEPEEPKAPEPALSAPRKGPEAAGKPAEAASKPAPAKKEKNLSYGEPSDWKNRKRRRNVYLPDSLIRMCRSAGDFPSTVPATDAACAFLYACRDRTFDGQIDYGDVPDEVRTLSERIDLAREKAALDDRLTQISRTLKGMDKDMGVLLWGLVYLVWHDTGLRTDSRVHRPDEIDFLQDVPGFERTLALLGSAVKKASEEVARREGRPIR